MVKKSFLFVLLSISFVVFSQEDTLKSSVKLKSDYILEVQGGGSLGLFNLLANVHYTELGYFSGVTFMKKNDRNFYLGGSFTYGWLRPYTWEGGRLNPYQGIHVGGDYFSLGISVGNEFIFTKSRLYFQGSALYFGGFDPAIGFSAKIDYSYNFHKNFHVGISSELFVLTFYGLEQLHLGPVLKYRF